MGGTGKFRELNSFPAIRFAATPVFDGKSRWQRFFPVVDRLVVIAWRDGIGERLAEAEPDIRVG